MAGHEGYDPPTHGLTDRCSKPTELPPRRSYYLVSSPEGTWTPTTRNQNPRCYITQRANDLQHRGEQIADRILLNQGIIPVAEWPTSQRVFDSKQATPASIWPYIFPVALTVHLLDILIQLWHVGPLQYCNQEVVDPAILVKWIDRCSPYLICKFRINVI